MSRVLNTNKNLKHFQVRPDFRTIYVSALFISNTYVLLLFVAYKTPLKHELRYTHCKKSSSSQVIARVALFLLFMDRVAFQFIRCVVRPLEVSVGVWKPGIITRYTYQISVITEVSAKNYWLQSALWKNSTYDSMNIL